MAHRSRVQNDIMVSPILAFPSTFVKKLEKRNSEMLEQKSSRVLNEVIRTHVGDTWALDLTKKSVVSDRSANRQSN